MSDAQSIGALLRWRSDQSRHDLAFQYPEGGSGPWQSASWADMQAHVDAVAHGLLDLGIALEDRCAILSGTRYEWILADFAILSAGAATTTIYPSNTAEECAFILKDSKARYVFCEDQAQVDKILSVKNELPQLETLVVIDGRSDHAQSVLSLTDLEARGQAHRGSAPNALAERIAQTTPSHLATLIYTSGTTGRPKGVELCHSAWLFEGRAIAEIEFITPDDHQYLWLPLSHSFGKVMLAAQLQVGFSTTVDGRIPKLVDNLAEIRPTFMAAAPRIFEKVYNRIVTQAAEGGALRHGIVKWAISLGKKHSKTQQAGETLKGLTKLQYRLADRLVFSKLRQRFGGRLRFFVSGSAPLSLDMAEFFHGAGIVILEGYGLTESSAASFVNRLDNYRFGTVGEALPGVEVKIAEDSEVLLRGPGIMRAYHGMAEATAEAIDAEGWLHTGDIGQLEDKHLRITDRKKDLIKTSGGKYVAPQKVESRLKALCPYLGHVLVHGNARNFCSALVTLDPESIEGWASERGLAGKSLAEIAESQAARAMVQEAVDTLNAELASYETIKKFAILDEDFSVENGALTASMKLKRKFVEALHKAVLDGFYSDSLASV